MAHPVALAIAAVTVMTMSMAQDQRPPQDPARDPPEIHDVMVTGCVVETSDPRVFILHNTVSRPEIRDLPRTFKLVQADTPVDVVRHVNHQVHATGRAQVATPHDPVPGDRLAPRELPAFAVQTIQSVSERCLTGQR